MNSELGSGGSSGTSNEPSGLQTELLAPEYLALGVLRINSKKFHEAFIPSVKKLPLTTLAQCLMEGSAILGDDTLLRKMLKLCGEREDKLAQELIHFECISLQVERDVIEPLFLLAEVEIPNIQKQRKHLAKLVLDMDSSRTRWQQTSKSSGLSSSLKPAGAKVDALREEMEEAANRVEICRVPALFTPLSWD